MHDPMTVAHEIKYPWFKDKPWPQEFRRHSGDGIDNRLAWRRMSPEQQADRSQMWPDGYRETFITIWHVDPERDGSDDSCGYSFVKLSKKQRDVLKNASWSEGQNPHFICCNAKEWNGSVSDAESLFRGICLLVSRVLRLNWSFDDVAKYAAEGIHMNDSCGKYGSVFCFLAGYHTNSQKDSKDDRQEHFHGILCNVARGMLTSKRKWHQHPKWHFWHWKIQCHPIGTFKRWAFSRCCKCGGRFTWGYSPVTNNWNSKGPRWFRGETDVYHSDCNRPTDNCYAKSEPSKN